MNPVWLLNLDSIPYADALTLQHRIVAARKRGELNDTLILLEHPPVFTLGRNAKDEHIIASRDFLRQQGIEVFRVERGGDVTYHGPKQLVGYPILDLRNFRQDVGWFVRSIEEMLIRALGDFGIHGRRIEKLVGVWVTDPATPGGVDVVAPGDASSRGTSESDNISSPPRNDASVEPLAQQQGEAKIVQIGARIENWITYHGFALNVDPNMAHFDLIVPCGIPDKAVTSMARVLNHSVDMRAVRERVAARFAEVFGARLSDISREELDARLNVNEFLPEAGSAR